MDIAEERERREKQFAENFERMRTVKKNFKIARIFNVYGSLVVGFVSFFYMYLWLSNANAAFRHAATIDEEVGPITFPVLALFVPFCPVIAVLSFFADVYFKEKFSRICRALYVLLALFFIANLFLSFERMNMVHMLLAIVYLIAGFWTEDHAVRSYPELDYLSTCAGYPDFNYLIERDTVSKYSRDREKWLRKRKKLDYFTPSEKPIESFDESVPEQTNGMYNVSVDDENKSTWFEQSAGVSDAKMQEIETAADAMELIESGSYELDESDYVIDDPRRRPL